MGTVQDYVNEIQFNLTDKVRLKDDHNVLGIVVCIHIAFSGIVYDILEKDGQGQTFSGTDEELEKVS